MTTNNTNQPLRGGAGNIQPDKIPSYIKQLHQWVMWRYEKRGTGKPTKVPYQVNGLHKAKSNDPSTWNTFENCLQALESGGFDGIGFAFASGDHLVGIDLDHCISDDGTIDKWAQDIIEECRATYVEISPSGTGFHLLCLGRLVKSGSKKWKKPGTDIDQGIEVYDHSSPRYFTMTGDRVGIADIVECQSSLDWLYERYFAIPQPEPKGLRDQNNQVDTALVESALNCIPADDYHTWIEVGMALKSGGMDAEIWGRWSEKSAKYEPGICEQKWQTFNGNRLGLGTIFHRAKQNGFSFPARSKDHSAASQAEFIDWSSTDSFGEPILFGEIQPPEIGSEFLPSWVRAYVDALAAQTQTPTSMAAMLVLSVLAACLQKRYEVCPFGDQYKEPLTVWVLVALPPASRKTAVLQGLQGPILEWENEQQRKLAPDIEKRKTEREISEKRIRELTTMASKADS